MKRNSFHFLVFSLLFVLLVSSTSARLLAHYKQDEKEVKGHVNVIPEASSLPKMKEDISNLMGSEQCEEEDEECQKRRMVLEAHLDYIYTQHHKQP